MPVFNQSRSRIIRLIFLGAFLVIIAQLFYLQVISRKYQRMADENAILRKTIYPPRGLLFDRKKKIVLNNTAKDAFSGLTFKSVAKLTVLAAIGTIESKIIMS